MKKAITIIAILLIILILIAVFSGKKAVAPTQDKGVAVGEPHPSVENKDVPPRNETVNTPNKTPDTQQPLPITIIIYTDSGFDPKTMTIGVGTDVTFTNKSSSAFWPAAGDHPQHLSYPEFDAKRAVPPGESYSFTFDKIGSWHFHDHLNDDHEGMITVK